MSDHIYHIKHAILDTCKLLDTGTDTGAGVLAVDNTNKITRIPAGSTGQLLTYTGSDPHKISWQSSSASSVAQYTLLNSNGGGNVNVDDGTIAGGMPIDGTKDVYAIYIHTNINYYSNTLEITDVADGHIVVFTVVNMASGGRYRLYSENTVFNGSGATGGGAGYFEMDSVGQGVQLVKTGYGWAVIGGGGAVLGTP
jgi:hypothetical protein